MVVAKDNLKTEGNKCLLFTEQREQNDEYLPQTAYPYNGWIGVNHVAETQYFQSPSNGRVKK